MTHSAEDIDKESLELQSLVEKFFQSHPEKFDELRRLSSSVAYMSTESPLGAICLGNPELMRKVVSLQVDIAKTAFYLGYTNRGEESLYGRQ